MNDYIVIVEKIERYVVDLKAESFAIAGEKAENILDESKHLYKYHDDSDSRVVSIEEV